MSVELSRNSFNDGVAQKKIGIKKEFPEIDRGGWFPKAVPKTK